MGYSLVSWKSKKQATLSLSSAKVKYGAVRQVVGELVCLERLLDKLMVQNSLPIRVFCDIQVAVRIAKNLIFHERTKHIEMDCHFVRDKLQQGLILLHHIFTNSKLVPSP